MAGYYFDASLRKCNKCKCRSDQQQCFSSAEDCNDEPYYAARFTDPNVVTDAVCTFSGDPEFYMMTADGPFGTIY